MRNVDIAPAAFDERLLPTYLKLRIAVVDADGRVLAAGRDLKALQRDLGATGGTAALAAVAAPGRFTRTNLQRWDVGDLPDSVGIAQRPRDLTLIPSLVDAAGRVDLALEPPGPAAEAAHRRGVRRLLLKALPQQTALIRDRTLADRALVLSYHGIGDGAALVDDLLCAAAEQAFELDPPIRTASDFAARLDRGRAQLVPEGDALRELLAEILPLHRGLRRDLEKATGTESASTVRDEILAQLDALVGPRMLTNTPHEWRAHLPRYLRAAAERWQKRGQRDAPKRADEVRNAAARLDHWRASRPDGMPWPPAVVDYRWLLEEFRVSLFAQQLGTVRPVSSKRLEQAWRKALAGV